MMTSDFVNLASRNISTAWATAFLNFMTPGTDESTPFVVTASGFTPDPVEECTAIREALDNTISALKPKYKKLQLTHTVANTIFPHSMWNPQRNDNAMQLFKRFERAWPRIEKCSQNRRGSYFRRLTAFRPNHGADPVNQLKHIIATYRSGNHRRSALQAAVFDPALDHTNSRQLGFPCLHQVSFTPIGNSELAVTGFYATQYLFDRAYGNYLGLCRLGQFMATQMGLKLTRMTCIASVAQIGTPNKTELTPLATELRRILNNSEETKP